VTCRVVHRGWNETMVCYSHSYRTVIVTFYSLNHSYICAWLVFVVTLITFYEYKVKHDGALVVVASVGNDILSLDRGSTFYAYYLLCRSPEYLQTTPTTSTLPVLPKRPVSTVPVLRLLLASTRSKGDPPNENTLGVCSPTYSLEYNSTPRSHRCRPSPNSFDMLLGR
jgi:hypothetical protein